MEVRGLAKWLHHSRTKLLVSPVSWTPDTNTAHDAAIAIQPHTCTQHNTAGWNGNRMSEILNA